MTTAVLPGQAPRIGRQPGTTRTFLPTQTPIDIPVTGNTPQTRVDPSLLPQPKETYSEWVVKKYEETLLKENPEHGRQHAQQDKQIYWPVFADWARTHVVDLGTTLFLYMHDANSWIFKFFPIKLSKATRYTQTSMEALPQFPHIGVRKVPFRNITAKITAREGHAVYTVQGFSMDYFVMQTEEGRKTWDMLVAAITSNLWAFVIDQAMYELTFQPSEYRKSFQLYPYAEIPRSVAELFVWEQGNYFALNKRPQGIHQIVAGAGRVMEQRSRKCAGIIMSRDDVWYAHGRDPTQIYYDKSGPFALVNRQTAGKQGSIDGVTIYPIPIGAGKLHDNSMERLLQNVFQTGGFVRFPENTLSLSPDQYTSEKRSVRLASMSRNSMTKYTLLDVFKHAPQFIPLDARADESEDCHDDNGPDDTGDNPSNPAGQINLPLLYSLITDREKIFDEKLHTSLVGNEEMLDVLIRYDRNAPKGQQFHPITVFGEMSECHVKTKYMHHAYRTMEHVLFADMSEDDIGKFERGMRLAKDLSRNPGNANIFGLVDQGPTVRACTGFENRRRTGNLRDLDDYLGCEMVEPNIHGGPSLRAIPAGQAPGQGGVPVRPYGFGSISGFMTIAAARDTHPGLFNDDDVKVITDFLPVYIRIVDNLAACSPNNPALSPKLIPMYNNHPLMSNHVRRLIVAWNTIFSRFSQPYVVSSRVSGAPPVSQQSLPTQGQGQAAVGGFGGTQPEQMGPPRGQESQSGSAVVTQLTFDHFHGISFTSVVDNSAPLGFRHVVGDSTDTTTHFTASDEHLYGGTLFTALPWVHPSLPLLERSGEIAASLRARPDIGRVAIQTQRGARFRAGASHEVKQLVQLYDDEINTENFYKRMSTHPLMRQYPHFITHATVNPLVRYASTEASDFEARFMGTYAMSATTGLAGRAVLLSTVCLQTLTAFFDNNIAIPLGAMMLRPFETQMVTSAMAVAEGPLGTTYFSGFDNNVSFDAMSQHFRVQAWLWGRTMISDTSGYFALPCIRGTQYIGGKGHEFVNQNATQPIQDMDNVISLVSKCDGERLGDRSLIGVLASYNSAVEQQNLPHYLDLRNNFRKENFAGRLRSTDAPRDFPETRPDLTYSSAPILNLLFDWDHNEAGQILDNQSFQQLMTGRAINYHVRETLSEVWAPRQGWAKTPSYHLWGNTERENCFEIQQSYSMVVDSC